MDSITIWQSSAPEPSSPDSEPSDRRRKIRKGTTSCWPCKRRKVRCSFPSPQSQTCTNCRRRGSNCVGQDVPEELITPEPHEDEPLADRLVRVEALITDLAQRVGSSQLPDEARSTPGRQQGILTPSLTDRILEDVAEPPTIGHIPSNYNHVCGRRDHGQISRTLLAAYPSTRDTALLLDALRTVPFYMFLRESTTDISRVPLPHVGPTDLEPPTSNAHPVLLAKQMIFMALAIQRRSRHSVLKGVHLSEPHSIIMQRLVDAGFALVTTNEELHGTLESLACMQLEAAFYEGSGNLRGGWLANRRAILVAQQMGIHQSCNRKFKAIDPRTDIVRETVWFRLLYCDRYYCLVLGYPQASNDVNIELTSPDTAHDDPLDRLDRVHATIAARILERMHGRELDPAEEIAMTATLDAELLRAAKSMPAKFWLHPNYRLDKQDERDEYRNVWLGKSQVFHYGLINQLHLPRLLRFDGDSSSDSSKAACMSASREIIARYLDYRFAQQQSSDSVSCLTFEFVSLMAAITLMLGHLDSHLQGAPRPSSAILEHQRLCDRTTMEQVLDAWESLQQANHDPMSQGSVRILRCLVKLEDDAAEGTRYTAQCLQPPGRRQHFDDDEGLWEKSMVLRIAIPYFGVVQIKRVGGGDVGLHGPQVPSNNAVHHLPPNVGTEQPHSAATTMEDVPFQQYWNPDMMEGADDWMFQGVDVDFFNPQ